MFQNQNQFQEILEFHELGIDHLIPKIGFITVMILEEVTFKTIAKNQIS